MPIRQHAEQRQQQLQQPRLPAVPAPVAPSGMHISATYLSGAPHMPGGMQQQSRWPWQPQPYAWHPLASASSMLQVLAGLVHAPLLPPLHTAALLHADTGASPGTFPFGPSFPFLAPGIPSNIHAQGPIAQDKPPDMANVSPPSSMSASAPLLAAGTHGPSASHAWQSINHVGVHAGALTDLQLGPHSQVALLASMLQYGPLGYDLSDSFSDRMHAPAMRLQGLNAHAHVDISGRHHTAQCLWGFTHTHACTAVSARR